MGSNNDFFVKFGDNAATWGKELEKDLSTARNAVSAIHKQLADLETVAANRRTATSKHLAALSKQAEAVQAQIDRVNSTAGTAKIDSGEGEVRNMTRELASFTAGAEDMWQKLGRTIELIGRVGEEFKAAKTTEARSTAQKAGATTQANTGFRFPTGTIVGEIDKVTGEAIRAWSKKNQAWEPAGTNVSGRKTRELPGAIPEAEYRRQRDAARDATQSIIKLAHAAETAATVGGAQTVEVSLKDIPEQVISEASFERVVAAVDRNVDATKAVEAAIDRLAGRLNVVGREEGAPGERGTRAERASNDLTKQDRSLLWRQFGEELGKLQKEQGAAAKDERWKQIVTAEKALRVTGASLITPETREQDAADEEASKVGKKRIDSLKKAIDDRKRQVRELDDELEQLAGVITESRDVGTEAEFGRKMRQKEELAKKLASDERALEGEESRAAQRERQRMTAIREAQVLSKQGPITADERLRRQGVLGQLSLGTDEERLRSLVGRGAGKLGNRDLKEIADTFTSQGYRVDYGPVREDGRTRLSNEELIKRIAAAGQAYRAAGGATNEDLSLRRVEPESKVSARVGELVGRELAQADREFVEFFGKASMTVEQAYRILGQNRATGGEDPTRRIDQRFIREGQIANLEGDIVGYRKPGHTKGRLEVGASVGEEGREQLMEAARIVEQFQARRSLAAKRDVAKTLRSDPSFNPYEEDLFGQVEGRGDEAKSARRNLAAMDQALRELDEFAIGLGKLDDALNSAQDYQQRVVNRMAAYERGESDDHQQYQRDREGFGRVGEEIAARREERDQFMRAYNIEGGSAQYMLDPTYRRELAGRVKAREEYDTQREGDRELSREQYQRTADLRAAVADYFGGARTFATTEGNTRDYFARNLPGVRKTGRVGREALEFIDSDRAKDPAQARAIRRMSAGMSAYAGNLDKLIVLQATGVADEEELNKLRNKIEGSLGRLLNAYQAAFKEAAVPDARLFLPPDLGFQHNILDRFVESGAGTVGGAQDAFAAGEIRRQNRSGDLADAQTAMLDEAAAAYNDPGRSEKNRKDLIKRLGTRISEVKKTIKGFDELYKAAKKAERDAGRDLNRLMGKDSVARVSELEGMIKLLEAERHKASQRGDAGAVATYSEQIYDRRDSIDREYSATPAISEAREAHLAATARREAAEITLRVAKQERDSLQAAKKTAQGRVDESDLVDTRKRLHTAENGVALAEKRLGVVTAQLSKAREERAARELATRERLSPSLQPEFDKAIALRDSLTEKVKKYEADPDLHSVDQDRVDAASSRLSDARSELRRVETGLQNLHGVAGALDPRTHDTARSVSAGNLELGQLEGLGTGIEALERQEVALKNARAENARAAEREREALEKMTAVFNAAEAARGRGGAAGGAGGDGGSGTPTASGAADDQGPSGDGILNRILRAVLDVNKTLEGGLKVTGRFVADDQGGGEITPKVRREGPTRGARSTPEARADFEQRVAAAVPAMAQLIHSQDDLAKGAGLVTRGLLSESRVVELFRDKLVEAGVAGKELREQTRAFAGDLGKAVGAERLGAAAQAAEDQAKKEAARSFTTRTGESMNVSEARTEMKDSLRQRRTQAAEAQKQVAADRAAALAAMEHANALKHLSGDTKREIGDLARLAKSTTDQTRLAEAMTRVYASLSRELAKQGAGTTQIRQAAKSVFAGAGVQTTGAEVEQIARTAKAVNGGEVVDKAMAAGAIPGGIFGEHSAFTQAMFGNHGFWSRMMASTGTFVVRNFAAGFVFGLTAALQQVIAQAIQTEATFVRVSHALESTGKSADGLRGDLQRISTDTGTALNDVYLTAAGLVGLFQTPQEIAGATKVVAQLQQISGGALNAQEAMGALASIQGAFATELEGGVDGLEHIADVLTVIQNNIGTNIEVTAEGIGRMSGLAQQLGLTLEETGVYVAQISKLTNQTGAAAGEQFSRILSAMQTGRGRGAITDAFSNVGGKETNVGALLADGNYSQVLRTMSEHWKDLNDQQRSNVALSVAGQRQAAAFAALMNNGAQSLDTITKAEDAHGEANQRMKALMETLNKQVDVLGTNFQNLASNLVRSGVLKFFGALLMVANLTLGTLNDFLTAINDFADENPMVGWLRTVGFGLAGMAAMIMLVSRSVKGLKATLAEMPKVTTFRTAFAGTPGTPISKPRMTEFGAGENRVGVGAPLTRAVGFGGDRLLGRPMEGLGRGFDRLSTRLDSSAQRIDAEGRARSTFTRRLLGGAGTISSGAGYALGGLAGASRATFQGRGQQYFGDLSTRLSERATTLRTRADYADMFGTRGVVDGADVRDTRASAIHANSMRATARAAELGASASTKLGKSLGSLAESGIGADLAIGGVIAALALWLNEMRETAKVTATNRENFKNFRESLLGKGGKTDEEKAREAYVGRSAEELKRIQEPARDGSWWDAGVAGAGALMGNAGKLLPGGEKFNFDLMGVLRGRFGIDSQGGETQGLSEANHLVEQSMKRLKKLARQPSITGEAIREAQVNIGKDIAARVKEIEADENLTAQQKTAAVANLEAANKIIASAATNLAAVADGLANSVALSADQVAQVRGIVESMRTLGGQSVANGVNLAPMLSQQIENAGVDPESKIGQLLDEIAFGGLSSAEIAVKNEQLLRESVTSLQASWLSKLAAGDAEGAADVWTSLQQAIADLAASGDASISAIVDEANSIADLAAHGGDFRAAAKAQRRALREIQAHEGQRTVDDLRGSMQGIAAQDPTARPQSRSQYQVKNPERARGVQGILNQQFQSMLESKVAAVSADYDTQIAAATNSATKADLEKQKAGAIRDIYRNAKGNELGLEADARAIQQSKIDWLTASQSAAQTAMGLNIAQMADAAAGIWNVAAREGKEEEIALQQYKDAVEFTGSKKSPEAVAAHTALTNKRHSNREAADARAAAARDAQLAAIAQGDAVSVASKSLSNANAAVAAAKKYGVTSTQYQSALAQQAAAQQQVNSATAAVTVAQAQLAVAYATARGDSVAAARAGAAAARAQLSAALQASGGANSAEVINAQAALVAANDAIGDAQLELVQSRTQVSIALAEAAGNTVRAARLQVRVALQALGHATKGTAEYNQARAEVISSRAAVRDAALQDKLDTIDFNLEMGRTTQSAAISAMRQILRTADLTKQQRRDLLLKIKGMKDELSDSPWNFGDIKLPTPYQMRRYVEENRKGLRRQAEAIRDAQLNAGPGKGREVGGPFTTGGSTTTTSTVENNYTFEIDGADIGMVRKVIEDVVGRPGRVRTAAARRR